MPIEVRQTNKIAGHISQAKNLLDYSKEDKTVSLRALTSKRDAIIGLESNFEILFDEILNVADAIEKDDVIIKK